MRIVCTGAPNRFARLALLDGSPAVWFLSFNRRAVIFESRSFLCSIKITHFLGPTLMRTQASGDTLQILGVTQLAAANANAFRDWVRESFAETQKNIEIDLSQTAF